MPVAAAHHAPWGRFRNPWPDSTPRGFLDFLRWMLLERHRSASDGQEGEGHARSRIESRSRHAAVDPAFATPRAAPGAITLTWVGHSSFLLQLGGVNILLDPMWGERASPVGFAGPRRLAPPGVALEALPPIDLVVQSHDHYDHLDRPTVRRLVHLHPSASWAAPLGVGAWLRHQGAAVAAELDWWEEVVVAGIRLACVPAQHFSGRGLTGRDRTLWCGWTLRAGDRAVYFAGDTAYHPELSAIARAYGPFDAALIPVGAYAPRWFMRPVHMNPEDAVRAYCDLVDGGAGAGCSFVGMHWGTFRLTDEPAAEPSERTGAAWHAARLPPDRLWLPRHGETRML